MRMPGRTNGPWPAPCLYLDPNSPARMCALSATAPFSLVSGASLSLWCGWASWHSGAWRPRREQATMRRPEWPSTRRHNSADGPDRSWADQCGNASTSGSPADMSPSLSCAGAASVSRRIGVAANPLPLVNSIRQRASILPSSKQMLRYVESACCKRMFQVF
jgi:hypothetical protein